jgi:alkylation response protein AidB-like acyl-CoA dehydrogenase
VMTSRPEAADLLQHAERLARECFAPRASEYDRTVSFPREDFDELRAAGLLRTTVPVTHGGYGLGMTGGDPLSQWRITSAVARGDLSLARCYEGHVNCVDYIAGMGTPAQVEQMMRLVVEEGAAFVFWGSEPPPPGLQHAAGQSGEPLRRSGSTKATPVDGGYVISGRKQYATSAGGATHAIVFATMPVEDSSPAAAQTLFLVPLDQPGIQIDPSWWQPLGMRSTVSHLVNLKDVFVPAEAKLGEPGAYYRSRWQARFIPQFGASFLGAAEAALKFTQGYVAQRGKAANPYVQHHLGRMRIAVATTRAFMEHTAALWAEGREDDAAVASNIFRLFAEEQATSALDHAAKACGASSLLAPHPLERIWRDLTTYVRHENTDALLSTVGKATLGLNYDPNFSTL